MNAVVRQTEFALPAEPRRHRFTLEEVLAIQAAGILDGERTELIDGEIVHMPSDGELHQRWSRALTLWLAKTLDPDRHAFLVSTTLRVGVSWAPSPDFFVYPAEADEGEVTAENVLLVVEESDSSLQHDLRAKPADYARHGVREYWAIDLNARRIHVHREPGPDGYVSVQVFERDQPAPALLIPGLTLRLADLPRVG